MKMQIIDSDIHKNVKNKKNKQTKNPQKLIPLRLINRYTNPKIHTIILYKNNNQCYVDNMIVLFQS